MVERPKVRKNRIMDSFFKQMIADDLDNVFLNEMQFANIHELRFQDGSTKNIKIIIDDDELKDLAGKAPFNEGLSRANLFFFVKAEDFGSYPAVGSFLWVDGKHYRVVDFNGYADGMLEVICEAVI